MPPATGDGPVALARVEFPSDEPELQRRFSWGVLGRHKWLIGSITGVALAAAAGLTRWVTPQYQASATIRIEAKEPNLPELFRRAEQGQLETEMEVLKSRTLLRGVASELGLQLVLLAPQRATRSKILGFVEIGENAVPGEYVLRRGGGRGGFTVHQVAADGEQPMAEVSASDRISFSGIEFNLTPAAEELSEIRFAVRPLEEAVSGLGRAVRISQPSPDAEIVRVAYRSSDPQLAWQVPNALVGGFLEQRRQVHKIEATSTAQFLKGQLKELESQLASAEQDLRSYREQYGVIQPQAEATSQVNRLVTMQTERSMLETQRSALSALLADVDAKAGNRALGEPSAYRRLLAYPALLQSQAAAGLLQSLTEVEDQREALLVRRTPEDSDVQALTKRTVEIEQELRGIAVTYLESVTHQIASLDAGLRDFRRQLSGIPERELQYTRLDRQPKVLESIYTMLQTRLKEAEIAVAAEDPSVRIVDAATLPVRPVSPRLSLNLAVGMLLGLLLGVGAAIAREQLDKSIRSRADVRASTGLPVIGLIPRIRPRRGAVPLIAEQQRGKADPEPSIAAPPPQRPRVRSGYTFLDRLADTPAVEDDAPLFPSMRPPAGPTLRILPNVGAVAAAYGALETNVVFSRRDHGVKVLVFTSALSGEGKTTTVVNFALALAQRGGKVLVIDADMRRGAVHTAFGGDLSPGFVDVLRGTVTLERAIRLVNVGGGGSVYYLTTGRPSSADLGLAASAGARDFIASTRDRFDIVLIDTPPVSLITDAARLAANADGVVLVARTGVTDAPALKYAVEQLERVEAPILGVVLNDIDLRRDASYDSVYRYFNGYEYSASTER